YPGGLVLRRSAGPERSCRLGAGPARRSGGLGRRAAAQPGGRGEQPRRGALGVGVAAWAQRSALQAASASPPRNAADSSSDSSMRSSWLYLATRSERAGAPVFIWPHPVATARSAMVVSSVSPERCDITDAYEARPARAMVSSVSESVPIWL